MRLDRYSKGEYTTGAAFWKQLLWYFVGSPLLRSRLLPFSLLKVSLLRIFGARIEYGVRLKPGIRVKFPWRLSIGSHSWIGEDVWIDNLAPVAIGAHCCISQGVYLCTGDHDWSREDFRLRARAIRIEDRAWIAAQARIAPGTTVHEGAVLTLGAVACSDLESWTVYAGNPAAKTKCREKPQSAPKRVLLLNQTFYPDASASAQYLTDLALELAQTGHAVTALCSARDYLNPERRHARMETHQGISIKRVGALPVRSRATPWRIVDALYTFAALVCTLFRMRRPDVVVVLTSPPLISYAAALYARWQRCRLVYWAMDLNPDQAVASGLLDERSLVARSLEHVHRAALAMSDAVVALDHFMQERLNAKGTTPEKIQVIPPWMDDQSLRPVQPGKNDFRRRINPQGKFLVMYAGNMSPCHPLQTMLDAAAALREDSGTQFVFIGGGARRAEVEEFIRAHKLSNVTVLPYQERAMLDSALSAADLHVVSLGEKFVGICHPSKLYGILAVERPFVFIGPRRSAIGELVDQGIGAQVAHGDVGGFVNAIRQAKRRKSADKRSEQQRMRRLRVRLGRGTLLRKLCAVITAAGEHSIH